MQLQATPRPRLDFLDVARGFAATLVMVEHGLQVCVPGFLEFSKTQIFFSQAAIVLFFTISGFVIPPSLESGGTNGTFWLRRFFRLMPVYWLSVGLTFAYLVAGGPVPLDVRLTDTGAWLAHLVLLQRYLGFPDLHGAYWSLHYEVILYATCSVLFALGWLRQIGPRSFVGILIGFTLLSIVAPIVTKRPPGDGNLRMVMMAAVFGLLAQQYVKGQITRRVCYASLTGMIAAAVLVWSVHNALFPSIATTNQLVRSVVTMGLAYGVFVTLLETRHRQLPALAVWLGQRSFPIYLLHPVVLLLLIPTNWHAWAFMPCLVGATVLLATLAHRLVETPGIALGRRIEKKIKSRVPETAPQRLAA